MKMTTKKGADKRVRNKTWKREKHDKYEDVNKGITN